MVSFLSATPGLLNFRAKRHRVAPNERVEEVFGWMKSIGGFRRTRYRGLARTQLAAYLVAAAYNLVRMARLLVMQAAAA